MSFPHLPLLPLLELSYEERLRLHDAIGRIETFSTKQAALAFIADCETKIVLALGRPWHEVDTLMSVNASAYIAHLLLGRLDQRRRDQATAFYLTEGPRLRCFFYAVGVLWGSQPMSSLTHGQLVGYNLLRNPQDIELDNGTDGARELKRDEDFVANHPDASGWPGIYRLLLSHFEQRTEQGYRITTAPIMAILAAILHGDALSRSGGGSGIFGCFEQVCGAVAIPVTDDSFLYLNGACDVMFVSVRPNIPPTLLDLRGPARLVIECKDANRALSSREKQRALAQSVGYGQMQFWRRDKPVDRVGVILILDDYYHLYLGSKVAGATTTSGISWFHSQIRGDRHMEFATCTRLALEYLESGVAMPRFHSRVAEFRA